MILPYTTAIGAGTATSVFVGKKRAKDGRFNTGASLTVAGASIASSAVSNTIIDTKYHELIEQEINKTSSAYIEQLTDEELDRALEHFGLLEDNNENVKKL